ncbi:MAG TPA: DUF4843 domain-containing protein [Chitinophagaceae bacterium]|nr:DUF4843 domain-containing protein [Chitinophagaceae bacterium]
MKKLGIFFLFLSLVTISLSSCIKNEEPIYNGAVVEMDAATWNANSVGVTYPILTRQPAAGRASASANTADSTITRRSGTVQLRVNLVGAQRATDTEVTYVVDATSTAVAGTHFTALPGKLVIPANSSYGFINVPILNPGATTGTKDLIITLTGGTNVSVNENYKTVGLRISQS